MLQILAFSNEAGQGGNGNGVTAVLIGFQERRKFVQSGSAVLHIRIIALNGTSSEKSGLPAQQGVELSERHFGLSDYGLECFWRQVSAMPRNDKMKVCLSAMAQISVTSGLVMNIETGSEENLEQFP